MKVFHLELFAMHGTSLLSTDFMPLKNKTYKFIKYLLNVSQLPKHNFCRASEIPCHYELRNREHVAKFKHHLSLPNNLKIEQYIMLAYVEQYSFFLMH